MERRREKRKKRRLTCFLLIGDRRHAGIVVDLSARGLFVQSNASLRPGERVIVALRNANGDEFEVQTTVARKWVVPSRLAAVAHGGVGLDIENVPDQYLRLLGNAYRIRVKQSGSPRSRILQLTAQSEDEARAAALAELGEGWDLLDVEAI